MRDSRRQAAPLFAFVLVAYLLTAAGHVQSVDVGQELDVARSMVSQHSFTIPPGTPYAPGAHGERFSAHGIGESLLLLPAVLVSRAVPAARVHAAQAFATSLVNPMAAAATTVVFFLFLLRLGFGIGVANALALLLSFATIQWPYAHDAFDATPTMFFVLLSIYAIFRHVRDRHWGWLLLSGCALGLALLMRFPTVLAVPILLVYLLWSSRRQSVRDRLGNAAGWLGPIVAALLLIGFYNWIRFSDPMQSGYGLVEPLHFDTPLLTGVAGLLLSPGKSVLLFTPVLVLGLWGLPAFLRRERALGLALLGIAAATILFYARWRYWSGDWAWGPRLLVELTPLMLLPGATVIERWKRLAVVARAATVALVGISLSVQLLGVTLDYQVQQQVLHDSGTATFDYWKPAQSQIARHAMAFTAVIRGNPPYPSSRRTADQRNGRPSVTTWDFWWRYAWLTGVNHLLILVVLASLLGGLVMVGAVQITRLRRVARERATGTPLPALAVAGRGLLA